MARRYFFYPKFHLSPVENQTDIKRHGLLMDACKAQNCRVWMCDWDTIPHIGQHLLQHHQFKLHRYAIFSIRHWNLDERIRKHASGIYYFIGNIPPVHIDLEFSMWFERGVDVALTRKGVCP